jgi:hypothetical protein
MKHMSAWRLDAPLTPRTLDFTGARDDLTPEATSEGLMAAWTGTGALVSATQDVKGGDTGRLDLSVMMAP